MYFHKQSCPVLKKSGNMRLILPEDILFMAIFTLFIKCANSPINHNNINNIVVISLWKILCNTVIA